MLNSVVIIGVKKSQTYRGEGDGTHFARLLLEVQRNFQNNEGIIEADTIEIKVYRGMADIIDDSYPIGSILALKGRIEQGDKNQCIIVAEKVIYINHEISYK